MCHLKEKLHILNVLELDKFERNHRSVQLSRGQGNILQQKETNKQKTEQKIRFFLHNEFCEAGLRITYIFVQMPSSTLCRSVANVTYKNS
jgi:hypothetical protein